MKIMILIITAMAIIACGKTEKHDDHQHNMGAAMTETQQHEGMEMAGADEPVLADDETLIYFTCPMDSHKDVHHVDPGECEKCGMKLVAGVVTSKEKLDYYGCPMLIHSHVRQDTPGTCDDCGMKLMPMRMVKS